MWCRGIRGATIVPINTRDEIVRAAKELMEKMVETNGVKPEDVACIIFTTTSDLNAEFPAVAAREFSGWSKVALMCGREIEVPEDLENCLRILILWNTEKSADEIVHIYINGAENLRQDLS